MMLTEVKLAMRINHNSLDSDIQRNIDSCVEDLVRVGIQPYQKDENGEYVIVDDANVLKEDELITKACELYCKWQYDYMGKGERFEKNYSCLRDAMSMGGDYIV